jgi:hypothetical protein
MSDVVGVTVRVTPPKPMTHAVLVLECGGYYVAEPSLVGTSREELETARRGEMPAARQDELRVALGYAARSLWNLEPAGHA